MKKIQKYLMLMFVTTLSLTFSSCGNESEPDSETGIDLTNTKLVIHSWAGKACDVYTETAPFDVLEFRPNGIVIERNKRADSYITGTYTISNNKITFNGLSSWSTLWGNTFEISPYESLYEEDREIVVLRTTATTYKIVSSFFCYIYHINNSDDGGNDNNGGNSGNNGNEGGGNSGGSSSNHHHPCKSCDETGDCWNCFGSGIDPITNKKCNTCHGTGKCQICHGKGYIIV